MILKMNPSSRDACRILTFALILANGVFAAADQPLFDDSACSGIAACLPGPNQKAIYLAMSKSIRQLKGKQDSKGVPEVGSHDIWGIPAELIAAAYGWDNLGSVVSRPLFPLSVKKGTTTLEQQMTEKTVHDFVSRLAVARLRVSAPTVSPIAALDLPGVGKSFYDTELIRRLVNTDLLPDKIQVIPFRQNKLIVPYVRLNTYSADLAQRCFVAASAPGAKAGVCKNLTSSGPEAASLRPNGPNAVPSFAYGFADNLTEETASGNEATATGVRSVLVELPTFGRGTISLTPIGSCTKFHDIPSWTTIPIAPSNGVPEVEYQKNRADYNFLMEVNKSHQDGCMQQFSLDLPPYTSGTYPRGIKVVVNYKPEHSRAFCGPSQLHMGDVRVEAASECSSGGNVSWKIEGGPDGTTPGFQIVILAASDQVFLDASLEGLCDDDTKYSKEKWTCSAESCKGKPQSK